VLEQRVPLIVCGSRRILGTDGASPKFIPLPLGKDAAERHRLPKVNRHEATGAVPMGCDCLSQYRELVHAPS
jgi:hypothetical protein